MADISKTPGNSDASLSASKSVADGLQNTLGGSSPKSNSVNTEQPVKENPVIAQNEDPAKSALKKVVDNVGLQADSLA
ncbi:hypothetical protein ACFL57_03710 [Candidatus Margulisiibacteriota bacterium]